MRPYHVVFEFVAESLAESDSLGRDSVRLRKICEQTKHAESVIQVSQSVDKGGISLLDDMVQRHARGEVALEALRIADLILSESSCDLLSECLVISKFG